MKSSVSSTNRRIPKPPPTLALEMAIYQQTGCIHVAGLDEAGRGALAGPLVAAAVILPLDNPDSLDQLNAVKDSKQLTFMRRDPLYDLILDTAVAYGIGSVPAREIDQIGITAANGKAMLAAVAQLSPAAQQLLVDGPLFLRGTLLPQQPIIRGDTLSLTIAAASIVAKVSRDRWMIALDEQYPHYGFAQHKGYGTRQHLAALAQYGPSPVHRYSFAPIRHRLL